MINQIKDNLSKALNVSELDILDESPNHGGYDGSISHVKIIIVSDDFKERLVEEGYNPSYGARPLRRAVMRLSEDSLAEEVLSGRIKDGDKAEVDIDESKKVIVKHLGKDSSKPELASAAV